MATPAPDPSDVHLAVQAQHGDLAAFDALVHRHYGRIWQFLHACCGDPHTAADLTQETFLIAYRQLHRYDPQRPWLPWLYSVARNKWVDHLRRQSRRASTVGQEAIVHTPAADDSQRRELLEDLWHWASQHLTPQQFQVLWLRYVEDLSVAEIARALRLTQVHVKVLLFRARRTLARQWLPAQETGRAEVPSPAPAGVQHRAAAPPTTPLKLSLGP